MNAYKLGSSTYTCSTLIAIISAVFLLGGCQKPGEPRLRFGAFFGSPIGMDFANPAKLGEHSYGFTLNERNGMVYTCKAGFIDIAHVREAADRTAYLQRVTYRNLISGNKNFSFNIIEPSKYRVSLSYPTNWKDYTRQKKETIAKDVSIHLGQYLAHTTLIWHEIVTWYGFATAGIFPDTISAFSWEDTYSDVMGVSLAGKALRDEKRDYDEAMTELLSQKLEELGVQSAPTARKAAKQIEGKWYTGGLYFFVDMKRRNLDVGLDDQWISPWLVPGICPEAEPSPCAVPGVESIVEHGFSFDVEIEPRILEKNKIYRSIGLPDKHKIEPQVDFYSIITLIDERENGAVATAAMK